MSGRLLLVSSDTAVVSAVKSALDTTVSLLQIDQLPDDGGDLQEKFQPSGIIIDSDVRSGVTNAFERIAAARRQFPAAPVIVLGNEMSAQLVLAALRAGANDFLDREASAGQMQTAINACLAQSCEAQHQAHARVAGILSALPSEQDQDFALNLAVRAAKSAPGEMVLYIDLSLPATQAGIALGMELEFGLVDAVKELARLDRALLESAVARDARSGLYVLPLSPDFRSEGTALEAAGFAALLQVLKTIFHVVVIGYGPFSHQRALLEMAQPGAKFFLCCNQRFSSIRGAGELLHWLAESKIGEAPDVVVHDVAPNQTPTPADIRKALNISSSIDIEGSWDELADHLNAGKPLALSPSRYSRSLDSCLVRMGLIAEPKTDLKSRLRGWLNLNPEAATP
jgi:pilus assembly protein CpaE